METSHPPSRGLRSGLALLLTGLPIGVASGSPELYQGDFPDPYVLPVEAGYLAFGTNTGGTNVPVLASGDLAGWSAVGDALPELPAWARPGRTWAPSVLDRGDGTFVLYFAARDRVSDLQCIGVATAASAAGPYTPAPAPIVCQVELGGSIDPDPFRDVDGTVHLLWKNDGNCCGLRVGLWSQPLSPDATTLVGQPTELLAKERPWEEPLIENPSMVYAAGAWHLLYSGGWWESPGYAVGHAVCASPTGPCTRTTVEAPVLASSVDLVGPGGQMVFADRDGRPWLAFHAWNGPVASYAEGGARTLRLRPVGFGQSGIELR